MISHGSTMTTHRKLRIRLHPSCL
uniref:Uncharacterized protein n=1 Tax=Arundo donax TaxID=35708 RepID=A0A0A9ALZ0_ARUDO